MASDPFEFAEALVGLRPPPAEPPSSLRDWWRPFRNLIVLACVPLVGTWLVDALPAPERPAPPNINDDEAISVDSHDYGGWSIGWEWLSRRPRPIVWRHGMRLTDDDLLRLSYRDHR